MCQVCKDVQKLDTGEALQVIGEAIKGKSKKEQDHLLDLADTLLDDGEPPVEDPELAEAWERNRRGE